MRAVVAIAVVLAGSCASIAAPAAAPAATPTGALDLMARDYGSGRVDVYDAAYEIRFPSVPVFTTNGQRFTSGTASIGDGHELLLFSLTPIPPAVSGGPLLDGLRDSMLSSMEGTQVTDETMTFGGVVGRHIVAMADDQGTRTRIDLRLAWDARHRVMIVVLTATAAAKPTPAADAFVASFHAHPDGKAPAPVRPASNAPDR